LGRAQTVLSSAFDYREYNKDVYGIEFPMINPWTSTPAVINSVLELFYFTAQYIDTVTITGNDAKASASSSQLPELAKILFQCISERLDWLRR
jgi:nuclear pore complex protein Nup133